MFTAQRNAFPSGIQAAAGKAVLHGEFAAGIQRDIPLTGVQVAKVNSHAFIAGNQADTTGVHAAERAGIHRHHGCCAFTGHRRYAAIFIHAVSAGDNIQRVSMNLCIHFGGPRDD